MFLMSVVSSATIVSAGIFSATTDVREAAAWGSAYVTTLPVNAEVWVDGVYAGRAPVFVDLLVPGRHAVTISRAGWAPKLATFTVAAGQVASVSIALERGRSTPAYNSLDHDRGRISVRGSPLGAPVFIDGVKAGTLPTATKTVPAGRHIVVVKPRHATPLTHLVTVYPDTLTVALFSNTQTSVVDTSPADDVLAPLDSYVPRNSYSTAGNQIAIHYRGVEVECALGSRSYTFNGRAASLSVPPALVQGKLYLPLSLLQRIVNSH